MKFQFGLILFMKSVSRRPSHGISTSRKRYGERMASTELIPRDIPEARSLTPKQEAFVYAYLETGSGCEAYRRAYIAGSMTAAAIRGEACRLLKHPNVALQGTLMRQRNIERCGATVEQVTRLLLEDRALAHQRGHTHAAVQATMGVAKIHGLLEFNRTIENTEAEVEELSDAELVRMIQAEQCG